ncbi:hypothetical protein E2562_024220 [Oryza meyeriana var. granulata]|uniref:Uncharacterized protein n=1 Tax=Oryza meyeriana var. granulata TaxID=110450 RepID=A0A6G1BZ37_9ORYZ|nr:hypothetical protein E2562_024220 [Oryza meyeriana var. granulata]
MGFAIKDAAAMRHRSAIGVVAATRHRSAVENAAPNRSATWATAMVVEAGKRVKAPLRKELAAACCCRPCCLQVAV